LDALDASPVNPVVKMRSLNMQLELIPCIISCSGMLDMPAVVDVAGSVLAWGVVLSIASL
jgi:hypothetical protein